MGAMTGGATGRRHLAHVSDAGSHSRVELIEQGRALRKSVPRTAHGDFEASPDRPDPVSILERSNETRVAELVPIRYGRMLRSPFTFYRGAPAIMAWDLAQGPSTGVHVQACGDAHLLNFGAYASPERRLVFDVNDFDETLPAPWEWDLKRLTASCVVAARTVGAASVENLAAEAAVRAYVAEMARLATKTTLDVHYAHLDIHELLPQITDPDMRKDVERFAARSATRTTLSALDKLTTVVDGKRTIVEDPPLVVRLPDIDSLEAVRDFFEQYRHTLADERRRLLDQFHFVDAARKVVGVGSVGLRAHVVLLAGRANLDPLFLQMKQAEASVLEPYTGAGAHASHGERVVIGQRRMQAASDLFLGWSTLVGEDFYMRQLRDMKGSVNLERVTPAELTNYAAVCGNCLARAHARSLDPGLLHGYLGNGGPFVVAMVAFAKAYADQNERDHAALAEAARSGRIEAIPDR